MAPDRLDDSRIMLRGFGIVVLASVCANAGCANNAALPPQAPVRSAVADASLRQMILDMATREACPHLLGKWIPLPTVDAADASTVAAPVTGRWLLRECISQQVQGGAIRIHLGGPGWQWVDRDQSGFSVRQYVYFGASADFTSVVDLGYDPRTRIASVWLTPSGETRANVSILGEVNAHPEGFVASIKGAVGTLIGDSPNAVARAQAGSVGTEQLRQRLSHGATLTFNTQTEQADVAVGQLASGASPVHPFIDSQRWLVNERQALDPSGLQIAGPFPAISEVEVNAVVESGPSLVFGTMCASAAQSRFDGPSAVASPIVSPLVVGPGQHFHIRVAPPACDWTLVTFAQNAPTVAALHVSPTGTAVLAASNGQVWVQVTILSFAFNPRKPTGEGWDVGGGAPDPILSLVTPSGDVVVVPKMQDTFSAQPMLRAAQPVAVSGTSPIQIRAIDSDELFDDPMGTAQINLDQLARGGAIDAEFRLNGFESGTIRIQVERLAGQ